MSNINLYATLSEYKIYSTARNQTASKDTDDDSVIVDLLEAASRYFDDKTGRQFYPSIESDSYDVPFDEELLFDKDVLEIISLTNGDGTSIASSAYVLNPANHTPYYSLILLNTGSVSWVADSTGNERQAIDMSAWCGYRQRYAQRGWQSVGTLGAAISNTTTLALTMTTGHTVREGHILKIDSEILNVDIVATNAITAVARGDNGSTAASHDNGSAVYKWVPQERVRNAVLETANSAYQRRFGKSAGETATVTAAGIVLTPRDIPKMAEEFISTFMRLV